jgi:hypothetical protein
VEEWDAGDLLVEIGMVKVRRSSLPESNHARPRQTKQARWRGRPTDPFQIYKSVALRDQAALAITSAASHNEVEKINVKQICSSRHI